MSPNRLSDLWPRSKKNRGRHGALRSVDESVVFADISERSGPDLLRGSDAAGHAVQALRQGTEAIVAPDSADDIGGAEWGVTAASPGLDDAAPTERSPWVLGDRRANNAADTAAWRGFGKAAPPPARVARGEENRLPLGRTAIAVEEELTPDRIFFALSELPVINWTIPGPGAMVAAPADRSGATGMLPLPPLPLPLPLPSPSPVTLPVSVAENSDPASAAESEAAHALPALSTLSVLPALPTLPTAFELVGPVAGAVSDPATKLPLGFGKSESPMLPALLPLPEPVTVTPARAVSEPASPDAPTEKAGSKASRFPEPSYRYPPARLPPEMLRGAQKLPANLPVPRIMAEQPRVSSRFRSINPQSWFDDAMRFALQAGASDLHLTLDIVNVRLVARLRIDGIMQEFAVIEGNDARTIMGRFKAAAELSSGGSFVPEESLYSINVDGELRKARVALFRDHNAGDALVLRLPPTGELLSLDELGFGESNLVLFRKLLRAANRMVLIAGPMGSGKTTTAHAALKQVTTTERIVWSVEDPVERDLPGVVQLEVDEANGAGFGTLLPVLVRSDYDTLFLGEIRDKATAAAGVRQSKAGRQVITTIHANDNVTALLRLIELAEDSPLSCMDAVRGVVSQRLMRRLNPSWDGETAGERYKGRVPVHEVLIMNDELTEAVMRDQPIREIKKIAAAASENTFERDAQRLIDAGITDQKEVDRVLGE